MRADLVGDRTDYICRLKHGSDAIEEIERAFDNETGLNLMEIH